MASLIGLDIGDVRIGVAIADTKAAFPAPLKTLEASANLAETFAAILHSHKVETVVIGYPRNMSGEPTAQTRRVEHIVKLLKIPPTIKVVWQDESLTSVRAEEELKKRGKQYQKGDIDALAATFILEDYVKSMPTSQIKDNTNPISQPQPIQHPNINHPKKHKAKHKSKKSKPKLSTLKIAILAVTGLIAASIIGVTIWYLQALSPKTSDDQYKVVRIEQGDTTKVIATKLQKESVIRSATAFTFFVRLNGINNLQAGSYRLSSADSSSKIAGIIAEGKVTTTDVLISPGLRLDEIKALLIKDGYSEQEIDEALVAVRDHPLLKDYPTSKSLEGYLYPNTYQIEPDTTVEQLLRSVLDSFEANITSDIKQGLADQGLSLGQAVILASIVQKEVADPKVQKTVAQVFIKRFNEGVVLGSDVTYKYAAAQFGTPDNPSSESPYNTRKFAGLPPTAISNFNISALVAVADPSDTSYNYFVAGDDGTTYFSSSLEQHEAYIAKYCIKGCQ